jgi:hypothetical protein
MVTHDKDGRESCLSNINYKPQASNMEYQYKDVVAKADLNEDGRDKVAQSLKLIVLVPARNISDMFPRDIVRNSEV